MKECAYEEDCYADLPPCGDRLHRRRMFSALNGRTHRFREYGDEELQVSAFMKCSGCGHFPGRIKDLMKKSRGFWKYIRTQFIWESAAAATGKVRLFVKRWR